MQQSDWQNEVKHSHRNPDSLLEELSLSDSGLQLSDIANRSFPLRVPRGFKDRILKGDAADPLLRQVLPLADEEIDHPNYSKNPLSEKEYQITPGLLRKYHGRALLVTTGACAIHCRYCFRRHFPYADANPSTDNWKTALACLAQDNSITEIILSGGDPFMLTDEKLSLLVNSLAEIPHIRRLRIHTRIPVVLPERITDGLISLLTGSRLHPVIIIHANHANELDGNARTSLKKIQGGGIPLLNQSVLLKGINDNAGILRQLSETLFESGVIPYYLHMLDPVTGSAHFKVMEKQARSIMQELHETLPGYLVPKLVREIPGKKSKIPVELKIS